MNRFLKTLAQRAFRLLGLEIRRRTARRCTMGEALAHIRRVGFHPATVIDVGVASGTPDLYEQFPLARHLLVEPLSEFEPVLKRIARSVAAEYVIAAAGPRSGTITLYVHDDLFGTSTLSEREGSEVIGVPREVPMARLDDLCRERGLRGPYLIKVDVQGAELSVVEGASGLLDDTEVLILETSLFPFSEDCPQLHDVVKRMKDSGFVVYDIFGGHHRPLDNALAQIDLVFVKDKGVFRRSHAYCADPAQREKLVRSIARRSRL